MQNQKSNEVREFLIKLKDKERVSRIYLLKKFKINPKFLDEILKNYLADDILRKEKEGREVAYIMSREKFEEAKKTLREEASAKEKKLYKWDGRIFKKGKRGKDIECPGYADMVDKKKVILYHLIGNAMKHKGIYEYDISDVAKELKCTERAIYKAISPFDWVDSKRVVLPVRVVNISEFLKDII